MIVVRRARTLANSKLTLWERLHADLCGAQLRSHLITHRNDANP